KTPNAVTAIRGTVVIAEVQPAVGGHQSTITILRGLVDVTRLDTTGALTGPAVKVGALERVTVIDAQPVSAPQKITRESAASLAADFSLVPKSAPSASTEALSAEVKQISLRDAMQLLGITTPSPTPGTSGQGGSGAGQSVTGGVSAVVGGGASPARGTVGAAPGAPSAVTNGPGDTPRAGPRGPAR